MERRSKTIIRRRARTTLDRLTEEIQDLKGRGARILFGIGQRLARIQDEALWEAGGFRSFEAYLAEACRLSRATAYRAMRVARHFNAEIAEAYGIEKLSAALKYMEATPADERPGDLLASSIRLRGPFGRFRKVPLHRASQAQIREATLLVADARRGSQRIPRADQTRARRLAADLPAAPPGTFRGRSRVTLRRGKDGRLAASFHAIPLDAIPAFLRALRRHLSGS